LEPTSAAPLETVGCARPDGKSVVIPEIAQLIRERNLQNDVLCLHDLSDRELAACYRLADLAVNPSLSEGGCPFTLTEALSVGTPVLMARIEVTEEIVTDPADQDLMLFDPYKWKDMAEPIEWALSNRESLLERQLLLYQELTKRSWSNVIDDYISLLDRISGDGAEGGERSARAQLIGGPERRGSGS
jgi:glycosyltransferase involved in cell wall biosynthesis